MISVFEHPWLKGLFGDDEAAALWSVEAQLAHMLAFEAAWSRALGAVGRVEIGVAERTAKAIAALAPDMIDLRGGTARDGLPVPALVEHIKAQVADPAAVHAGATSQDVLDTALALTLRHVTDLLLARIAALHAALARLDDAFGTNPIMGRTRMQAAMPITAADRLRSWRLPLDDHRVRLDGLRPQTERIQLGGAVGDRAALGADGAGMAAHLADTLGLADCAASWHTRRDGIADYASCLSLISGGLGKIGQDICLMAQQGIDEIALSGGGGSSAMPHKQNPVLAELLVTLARFNAVQVSGMHQALVHEQERSGAAWALEWMILPQMTQTTARGLSAALELCDRVKSIGGSTEDRPG